MMKAILASVILFSISATASAAFDPSTIDCSAEAYKIAKMNLDSKAQQYSFSESDVAKATLKRVSTTPNGSMVYVVDGFIYKASYGLQVQLDSSCSIEAILIKEY